MENTKLKFESYLVTDISIKLNPTFKPKNEPIRVNPIFSKKLEKIDGDRANVLLSVEIKSEESKPFFGHIVIQGMFFSENWENDEDGKYLMEHTTLQLMFPYLRHALSEVTTLLNVPPYVLPIVNTDKLFNL